MWSSLIMFDRAGFPAGKKTTYWPAWYAAGKKIGI